jgi:hypothetical protein
MRKSYVQMAKLLRRVEVSALHAIAAAGGATPRRSRIIVAEVPVTCR